jgi:hypothetical protein
MKTFINMKTGYSAGMYGCSNEYFTLIAIDEDRFFSVAYKGMYGAENRVESPLRENGFKPYWAGANWGKLPAKDGRLAKSETEALRLVNEFVEKKVGDK